MTTYDRLIIDGNNFLFRAFYTKRPDKYVNGVNTTPIHQFLYMLKSVVEKFHPQEIFITWDKKLNPDAKNFRKELVAYKEHRPENEKTIKIFEGLEHIQKFIDALGIKTIYPYNLEADDAIRFLALLDNKRTVIVSSDNDLLQLVSSSVDLYFPTKQMMVNLENFEDLIGIEKKKFILYKAILGDISDNIPGLEKHGPVRAKNLTESLFSDDVHTFFNNMQLLEESTSLIIYRNLQIIDLAYAEQMSPEDYEHFRSQLEENSTNTFQGNKLNELFEHYQFYVFKRSIGDWNSLFNKSDEEQDLLLRISL